jgi:glycosyltransferase involved in cell wall biosynthesis
MNQLSPSVSVVMPVYNQERYVMDAVNSVLNQTFKVFELIIVNDGSTDRTAEILARYQDPRIRIIHQPNAGFIAALLTGFQAAQGEWIARMDSDDVSHPERLAKQVEFLGAHPECAFVGTAYGLATPNDFFLEPVREFDWKYVEARQITRGGRVFGDPTVMFHRQTAAGVGYYDQEFDNENPLWYRLLKIRKGAVLGETLYYNRWLMGSVSKSRFEHWSAVHFQVRKKYDAENINPQKNDLAFDAGKVLTRKLKEGVVIYLRAGDRKAALQLAWFGWKSDPLSAIRNKLLLYAVLGIQGIRINQLRRNNSSYVRRFPPFLTGDELSAGDAKT